MNCWKVVKAKDFIEFNPSLKIHKGQMLKKVAMDKITPRTKFISEYENAPYSGGAKFQNNDTLLARITPCLENGKTAFVDFLDEQEIGFGSTEFIVLRAKDNISDPNYVYYLATSDKFREVAIKSMVGSSGRQRVQLDVLKENEFSLPPLNQQQKIASMLMEIDEKIRCNNKINDNLLNIATAIFKKNFGYLEPQALLQDLCEVTMGQSPEGSSLSTNSEGTVFYQGKAEFGSFFPNRKLFTTNPKRMAQEGDILLSVRAPVGTLNIANEKCCIGRGLAALSSPHQGFLYLTLRNLEKVFNSLRLRA